MNSYFCSTIGLTGSLPSPFSIQDNPVIFSTVRRSRAPALQGNSSEPAENQTTPLAASISSEQVLHETLGLTLRRPGELIEMNFSDEDLYLENGVLSAAQTMTLIGPGGIGKSRLIIQLAECTTLGKPFLGWKVTPRPLRWLILQAENSNRRLKQDLEKIRQRVSPEEWEQIHANLLLHTIEKDHDTFLSVRNHASAERLAQAIKAARADVVVFDPLYAFAAANLNSDAGMNKTCQALSDLAKLGNPNAAIIVVHHSLTGKAGAQKATGLDRASYSRGSKTLQFWTRGQINIAPVSTETNERLVVSCGKNSNGPEFQPFGIRLNKETMAYEIDEEFNLENWKAGISGGTEPVSLTKPQKVAELVKSLPLTRKDLCARIMDEYGCSQATAYSWITEAEGKTVQRNARRQFEAITGSTTQK